MNILIFGGGELQLSLIKVAKSMGLKTVVIDPNPNALAKELADVFEVVAGDDFNTTMKICDLYAIDGIVTSATDKPLEMMARIAEARSYPFPSLESIKNTIDKFAFKKIMIDASLPVAKGQMVSSVADIRENLNFPVIVKPVDNSGSRGVIKVEDANLLEVAIDEALKNTNKKEVLVEEFIEGDEISVEALVISGKVLIIQITDKVTTTPPYNVEIAQIQPSKYCSSHWEELQNLLQSAIDKLKLDHCAIHPELKINKNGVFLIEIGPRLGGDYITSHLVPLSTGINIEQLLIQIALKAKTKLSERINLASMVKYFEFPVGKRITYINFDLNDTFNRTQRVLNINFKKDDVIGEIKNSIDRYGNIILQGKDRDQLVCISKKIENEIKNKISFQ